MKKAKYTVLLGHHVVKLRPLTSVSFFWKGELTWKSDRIHKQYKVPSKKNVK